MTSDQLTQGLFCEEDPDRHHPLPQTEPEPGTHYRPRMSRMKRINPSPARLLIRTSFVCTVTGIPRQAAGHIPALHLPYDADPSRHCIMDGREETVVFSGA